MTSLTPSQVEAVENEIFRSDIAIIASEEWSHQYSKDPASHAKLIKGEANLMRTLRRFFRTLSGDVDKFVSWSAYNNALLAKQSQQISAASNDPYSVEVIVQDVPISDSDNTFLKIVFDDLVSLTTAGAQSGESIYNRYYGITNTTTEMQRYARQRAAELVGKRIDKDGNIIENPNADYRISDTTRDSIRESIRTSLSIGETQQEAVDRLRSVIKDPRRAELIAQTESVNTFQGGLLQFGLKAGAVGKESQTLGAVDRCATYAQQGIVAIDYLYDDTYSGPAYHPRCRCGLRLVFPEELGQ